ncbi:MAG: metal-dependent transcriptional regulator [Candidatus Micrarchaeaceae archaeon]
MITKRERDCLMALYENGGLTLSRMSKKLSIKPPTAYELAKKLVSSNLIEKDENNVLRLTEKGAKKSEEIEFKHRVLETLMFNNGGDLEGACEECKKIDYMLDDRLAHEIYEGMKKPCICPHGKPIKEVR